MSNSYVSVEQLIEAGAHFGHLTRRWNPKMEKYIFGERNGIHIIDVRKTKILIEHCRKIIHNIAEQGKIILFVGTKMQAKSIIAEQATRAEMNYVTERWLGGMLTNFTTIRRSIRRLSNIDKMETDGTFEKITKKERLLLTREKERLRKVFGGIENMQRLPGAIFVVDARKEHLAVKEARILGIPVIGIVDTNTDPDAVDFPIPANDDSVKAIDLITSIMADAIIEGSAVAKVRAAELAASQDRVDKENEFEHDGEIKPAVQRRMRERRGTGDRRRESREPRETKQTPGQEQHTNIDENVKVGAEQSEKPEATVNEKPTNTNTEESVKVGAEQSEKPETTVEEKPTNTNTEEKSE
ncbi:MAG: 30S ribosomal protein S2 [Ignavibacteria bacterium]|jgi:small subunit ribosomal protein S2|nr:30S ribosomal protein S2 [Ignavibacteria bacterium]